MDRYSEYRRVARQLAADALALVPGPNFTRVLGRNFSSHERPFVLFIPAEGAPAAIVPNLELRSFDQVGFEGEVFDWRDQDGYQPAFTAFAQRVPLQRLAVEGQVMRVFVHHALLLAYPEVTILDCEEAISGLRVRKTDEEIAAIREAIRISERGLEELLDAVRCGQTEKDIEQLLLQALFRNGAEGVAFPPIVAAGENSALPHARARADYEVQPGDALLLDFGARFGGFAADVTRTVFLRFATDEARDVYETVLRANLAGHDAARPGATCHTVDDMVTGVLETSPYSDRIRTKTGHGLGREVHEAPYIVRGNRQVLEPGMVFTNEPGLYRIGGFGVRIEDDILVTETGSRSLTAFPKELTVVP